MYISHIYDSVEIEMVWIIYKLFKKSIQRKPNKEQIFNLQHKLFELLNLNNLKKKNVFVY